jgi:ethanolamine ammonia-lyase small subunit
MGEENAERLPAMVADSWDTLKAFTAARIALGRAGESIPVKESLAFKLAHAHARDAVYSSLDIEMLEAELKLIELPVLKLHSRAGSRQIYLQRPDLGRLIDDDSAGLLNLNLIPADICILLADGLSAQAINTNAIPLLKALLPLLKRDYLLSPLCLVEQARVAIADPIAFGLGARLSLILIGERPGLSSAESVGAYLTYQPKPGLTDESRNCVSNIRDGGLNFPHAAQKIYYLIQEAFRKELSGVALKDNERLLEG